MKKVFLSAVFVSGLALFSQAQLQLGIAAGANVSNQHSHTGNSTKLVSPDAFRGYHAGLIADVKVIGHLYLQPQLLYTQTGAKYKGTETSGTFTARNLEMPLNVLFKAKLPFGKLVAGGGPAISYGLSGKMEEEGQTKKLYSGDMKQWRRASFSANALMGIEFNNGIFANVSYQAGLNDINSSSANIKTRSASVSVGYLINWN